MKHTSTNCNNTLHVNNILYFIASIYFVSPISYLLHRQQAACSYRPNKKISCLLAVLLLLYLVRFLSTHFFSAELHNCFSLVHCISILFIHVHGIYSSFLIVPYENTFNENSPAITVCQTT